MMAEWQEMDSAPKDGTRILVSDGKRVEIAAWHRDDGERLVPSYPKPYWEPFDNSFFETEGEWIDVKRWMPLPTPPDEVA